MDLIVIVGIVVILALVGMARDLRRRRLLKDVATDPESESALRDHRLEADRHGTDADRPPFLGGLDGTGHPR